VRNRRFTSVFLLAFFVAILLPGCTQGPWEEFTSEKGDFTVLFPGKPKGSTDFQNIGPGASMSTTSYTVAPILKWFGARYTVASTKVFASNIQWDDDAAIRGGRQGIINEGGKIVGERDVEVSGYNGREFEVTIKDQKSTLRMFRVENELYVLEVVRWKRKDVSSEMEKFFDSFQLTFEPSDEEEGGDEDGWDEDGWDEED